MTHESLGTVLLLEELCNGVSLRACLRARTRFNVRACVLQEREEGRDRQGDNQTSIGQRVREVRDELSLASAVCARVVAELRV